MVAMNHKPRTFVVTAERGIGNWWVLQAAEVGAVSQVKRLDQAAAEMLEAISYLTQLPEEDIIIDVQPVLSESYSQLAQEAATERAAAESAQQRATALTRQAALQLRKDGLTLREIGQIMGISYQRAAQIVA